MTASGRHLAGAFAAMVFVGASWGANLPVTKVILVHLDLLPMAAVRIAIGTVTVGVLLWLVEGRAALRIAVGVGRFLALGLMMSSFFVMYALGIHYSNPITASAVQVVGPLVAAATVWAATGQRFDPGFGTALALTVLGGAILAAGSLLDKAQATFGGGEIVVLASNVLWTLYSLKAQAWFGRESQLHRTYVASLSATGWLFLVATAALAIGWARSPFGAGDAWIWTQLVVVAVLASGLGGYFWNVGASRLGVAVASLWVNLVPFFAVLFSMAYGFQPNVYQVAGGLVALSGVVYMQMRKLRTVQPG
jgi:drug/metabolite transporter (DMT)-like permease